MLNPKNSVRWFVRLFQAILVFGIVLFGLDALNNFLATPDFDEARVVDAPIRLDNANSFTIVIPERSETVFSDAEYHYMALSHHRNNEYMEAIVDYTRALNMSPERANSRLNRGVAYEQLNQPQRAMFDYNAFLNRDSVTRVSANAMPSNFNIEMEMAHNRVYEFPFYAAQGQVVDIFVNSAHSNGELAVDPLIVVIDENGMPVAADDDILRQDGSLISMNSAIEGFEAPASGRYTLRISHAGGNPLGTLALDFNVSETSALFGSYSSDHADGYGCSGGMDGR